MFKIDKAEQELTELRRKFTEPLEKLKRERTAAVEELTELETAFNDAVVNADEGAAKDAEKKLKTIREDIDGVDRRLQALSGKSTDDDPEVQEAVEKVIAAGIEDMRTTYFAKASEAGRRVEEAKEKYLESLRELSSVHRDAFHLAQRIVKHGGNPPRLQTLDASKFYAEAAVDSALSPLTIWGFLR